MNFVLQENKVICLCLLARSGWNFHPDLASNLSSMTNTYCCVYSVETPDDGQ